MRAPTRLVGVRMSEREYADLKAAADLHNTTALALLRSSWHLVQTIQDTHDLDHAQEGT